MEIKVGIPVSPGIAIATAHVIGAVEFRIPRKFIRKDEVNAELERWEKSKEQAKAEIVAVKQRVHNVVKDEVSLIFDTHLNILDDPTIDAEIRDRVKIDRQSPEYAVSRAFRKVINAIKELEDSYFGQRVSDFIDVQRRLLHALTGGRRDDLEDIEGQVVVVSHDLTPSQTATLPRGKVAGFATDLGGSTSHTAILANALGIPAAVGLGNITGDIAGGETVIIDGSRGTVIISPDEATRAKYEKLAREYRDRDAELRATAITTADELADGTRLAYLANIEFDYEVDIALRNGASGLGLYRTEFIFAQHPNPTEEEHFNAIMSALRALNGKPMVLRTLDFGADKFREVAGLGAEENPFLGNRSLRLCLSQPEMFRTQIRAILRASPFGDLRVMLPMVGSLQELRMAKAEFDMVREELRAAQVPFNEKLPIGIMVEVPSAALVADTLAKESDFFSIGTNDLVQYTLAVDRNNPSVSHLFHHTHPAVLLLIKRVIDAANAAKIPVSVCGEMAAHVDLAVLLVGLGLRMISSAPAAIPGLKTALNHITIAQAQEIAARCLALDTVEDIDMALEDGVRAALGEKFAHLLRS